MIKKIFDPKNDITAYELAVIVGKLGFGSKPISEDGVSFEEHSWEALPPEIKRHWR